MIRLSLPILVISLLAGLGVYAMVARRHVVMVLIGAELLLAAAGLLLVTADVSVAASGTADALVSGQVATMMTITIAAAEIGLALAVVLALYRARATSDLTLTRELGEASPSYPGPGDALEETR